MREFGLFPAIRDLNVALKIPYFYDYHEIMQAASGSRTESRVST